VVWDGFGAHWEWACSVSRLDHGFPFVFPLLSLFMVRIPNLFPILSQSFKKVLCLIFIFASYPIRRLLYCTFYEMTGKESSWGDYPFSFSFIFFAFFFLSFLSPLAEMIKKYLGYLYFGSL